MRGFFAGLFWGIVGIASMMAVMSLLSPLPPGPDVVTETPSNSSLTRGSESASGVEPTGVDADLVNATPTVPDGERGAGDGLSELRGADTKPTAQPEVGGDTAMAKSGDAGTMSADTGAMAAPDDSEPTSTNRPSVLARTETAPDTLGTMDQTDTLPTHQPVIGSGGGAMTEPGTTDEATGVVMNGDAAVAPVAAGAGLAVPQDDTDLALSRDPTQPSMPTVSDAGSGFDIVPTTQTSPSIASGDDTAPIEANPADIVGQSADEAVPSASDATEMPDAMTDASPVPSVDARSSGVVASTDQAQPMMPAVTDPQSSPDAATTPMIRTEPADPPAPRVAALPQAGTGVEISRPSIGQPVVPLTERGVAQEAIDDSPPTSPPIIYYGEPFSNPEDKPLMAIILIDDENSIGVEALANFPQPLTMAVDPTMPDAAERMARHRAAGFEVVALINLPVGATAQDAEVSLTASFAAMPEVVAVLEGTGTGIQSSRPLADQVSTIVENTGHGLIMQNNGLNTVYKLAVQSGIPAGVVFRDFDGAGQSGKVMRRFFDQAAFRAGQSGAVIMLGRVRPDTVSALLLWALQDRASRVALAPVSAVLNGDDS